MRPINLPEKDRVDFDGTNRGNMIPSVQVTIFEELWCTTYEKKRRMYGPANRVMGGGRNAGDGKGEDATSRLPPAIEPRKSATKRSDEDVAPVNYRNIPKSVCKCIVSDFNITDIDLSVGDAIMAEVALEKRIRCLGRLLCGCSSRCNERTIARTMIDPHGRRGVAIVRAPVRANTEA